MTQGRFGEPGAAQATRSTYSKGLIVLIGGTTGTGKSTIASEVAPPARDHAAHLDGLHPRGRCARSSRTTRCRRSITPSFEVQARRSRAAPIRSSPGLSSSPGWSAWASTPRFGARSPRAGRWCWRGCISYRGWFPPSLDGVPAILHVVVEISNEEAHRMHFHVRDLRPRAVLRAMDKYLERASTTFACIQSFPDRMRPVLEGCRGCRERERGAGDRIRDRARDGTRRSGGAAGVTQLDEQQAEIPRLADGVHCAVSSARALLGSPSRPALARRALARAVPTRRLPRRQRSRARGWLSSSCRSTGAS